MTATGAAQPRRSRPGVRRRLLRARGIALMMVVAVIAIATVLSYVMLSTATLQNRAGSNQSKSVSAEYLAESGLNVAMYYLQHPEHAPAKNADGYWPGMNGEYTLPNGSSCTLSVVVTRDRSDAWSYEVAASAAVGADDDPARRVTRTTGARVYVRNEFVTRPGAALANNDITFFGPITTFGDVYSSKKLGLKTGPSTPVVNGVAYTPDPLYPMTGYTRPTQSPYFADFENTAEGAPIAPTSSDINLYKKYEYRDQTYHAEVLGSIVSTLTGLLGLNTREPTQDNAAGVVYKQGNFTLQDNVRIEGTLVVEGNLDVRGTNIVITPKEGFPALIVTGNMDIYQSGKSITTNGATYIGGQLRSNNNGLPAPHPSLASTFTVNGALMFGSTGTAPIMTGYNAKTVLNYHQTKARAPEISSALRVPKGVTIVRWGLPPSN